MTVFFNSYDIFALATLFFITEERSSNFKTLPNVYEDTKALLDDHLDHIAKIHEQRLQGLKKFTDKEWLNPSEVPSQHDMGKMIERELYDMVCTHYKRYGDKVKSQHGLKYNEEDFFFDKSNLKKEKKQHEYEDYEISDNNDGPKEILRKSKCSKESYKQCKKACKDAASNTCSYYSCSKGMKKELKKKCKKECKSRLYYGDYSDSVEYYDVYYYY